MINDLKPPVPEDGSASQIGDILATGEGREYQVGEKLGSGATAHVYVGVDKATGERVALKVLRLEQGAKIAENFWLESEILAELANAELETKDGIRSIPRVLGIERKGAYPFIALELIEGAPLDKLLEKQSKLNEPQGLAIAAQFLRVLHLLHTKLERSYTDMQLKNIWLLGDLTRDDIPIKVMDWNHVSAKSAGDALAQLVAADLERFGTFLYLMLTGKGAVSGEEPWRLITRGGDAWANLSFGAKKLVLRALAQNPAERFASADEFRQGVQTLRQVWAEKWQDNLTTAGDAVEEPEPNALYIKTVLDVAAKRGASESRVKQLRGLLVEKVGPISAEWNRGESYYKSGAYKEALEIWTPIAEKEGRLDLWRWVMAAQVGQEFGEAVFKTLKEPLERGIKALGGFDDDLRVQEKSDAAGALAAFKEIRVSAYAPLANLRREVMARLDIEQAQELARSADPVAWRQAAEAYRRAEPQLAAMTERGYQKLLREFQGWTNLETRAQELDARAQIRQTSTQQEERIRATLRKHFPSGKNELENALVADPENTRLAELGYDEALRLRDENKIGEALALLSVVSLYARLDNAEKFKTLRAELDASQDKAKQEAQYARWIEELGAAFKDWSLDTFDKLAPKIPESVFKQSKTGTKLIENMQVRFAQVTSPDQNEGSWAAVLLRELARLDPAGKPARQAQYDAMLERVRGARDMDWENFLNEINAGRMREKPDFEKMTGDIERRIKTLDPVVDRERIAQLDRLLVEIGEEKGNRANAASLLAQAKTLFVAALANLQDLTGKQAAQAQTALQEAQKTIAPLGGSDGGLGIKIGQGLTAAHELTKPIAALDQVEDALRRNFSGAEGQPSTLQQQRAAAVVATSRVRDAEKEAQKIWSARELAKYDAAFRGDRPARLNAELDKYIREIDVQLKRLPIWVYAVLGVLGILALAGIIAGIIAIQNAKIYADSVAYSETQLSNVASKVDRVGTSVGVLNQRIETLDASLVAANQHVAVLETRVAQVPTPIGATLPPTEALPSPMPTSETPLPSPTTVPPVVDLPTVTLDALSTNQIWYDMPTLTALISPAGTVTNTNGVWQILWQDTAGKEMTATLAVQLNNQSYVDIQVAVTHDGKLQIQGDPTKPPLPPAANPYNLVLTLGVAGQTPTLSSLVGFTVQKASQAKVLLPKSLRNFGDEKLIKSDLAQTIANAIAPNNNLETIGKRTQRKLPGNSKPSDVLLMRQIGTRNLYWITLNNENVADFKPLDWGALPEIPVPIPATPAP